MNTKYEIRPVVGYEGLYSVSNTGEVFSHNYNRTGKTRQKKLVKAKNGYLMVSLYQNGKEKKHLVHRLVLETFVPNPENKPCCDHINTDKGNNNISNLRWCTYKENQNNPVSKAKMSEARKGKTTSEETRRKMSAAKQGKKNHNYDHTRYTFRNKANSQVFVGTRYDFCDKYNLKLAGISKLVNGEIKSTQGWILV